MVKRTDSLASSSFIYFLSLTPNLKRQWTGMIRMGEGVISLLYLHLARLVLDIFCTFYIFSSFPIRQSGEIFFAIEKNANVKNQGWWLSEIVMGPVRDPIFVLGPQASAPAVRLNYQTSQCNLMIYVQFKYCTSHDFSQKLLINYQSSQFHCSIAAVRGPSSNVRWQWKLKSSFSWCCQCGKCC